MKLTSAITFSMTLTSVLGFTSSSTKKTSITECNAKVDGKTGENTVTPTNNFILVKLVEAMDQTEGGIILTGKKKQKKTEGTVVSVGPGKTHPQTGAVFQMPVDAGDGVVFGKLDGTEMDIDGSKHTLVQDDDILLKFTGDDLTIDSADVVRDAVLVAVEKKEEASESGILIAKTSKSERKPSTGKVVKVGPGRFATNGKLMDMEVEAGDFVKFRDYAQREVEIGGEDYSVVRMADILAKF